MFKLRYALRLAISACAVIDCQLLEAEREGLHLLYKVPHLLPPQPPAINDGLVNLIHALGVEVQEVTHLFHGLNGTEGLAICHAHLRVAVTEVGVILLAYDTRL